MSDKQQRDFERRWRGRGVLFRDADKGLAECWYLSGDHPAIMCNGFLHTEQHCKRNVLAHQQANVIGSRNDPISLGNAVRDLVDFGKRIQRHREAVEAMERNRK